MIKNVVFDYGQVLIHFDPHYMTERYIEDEKDIELCKDVIFDRLYWDKLDLGTIEDSEVIEGIKSRLPKRLWESAQKAYENWFYNNPEIEGMRELVCEVKNKYKKRVYLLSNISRGFSLHAGEFPILKYMDGCVFSGACGMAKPNSDIYEHLLSKFNLKAEETIFIDDRIENLEAAKKLGIHTFLFKQNVQELRMWLQNMFNSI